MVCSSTRWRMQQTVNFFRPIIIRGMAGVRRAVEVRAQVGRLNEEFGDLLTVSWFSPILRGRGSPMNTRSFIMQISAKFLVSLLIFLVKLKYEITIIRAGGDHCFAKSEARIFVIFYYTLYFIPPASVQTKST